MKQVPLSKYILQHGLASGIVVRWLALVRDCHGSIPTGYIVKFLSFIFEYIFFKL